MTSCKGKNCNGNCYEPRQDCGLDDDNGLDDCCCLNHIPEARLCCFALNECPFNLPKGKYETFAMFLCAIPLLGYCLCQKCCCSSEGGEESEDSLPYRKME